MGWLLHLCGTELGEPSSRGVARIPGWTQAVGWGGVPGCEGDAHRRARSCLEGAGTGTCHSPSLKKKKKKDAQSY